jgi:PAS domain S-box-containing protein
MAAIAQNGDDMPEPEYGIEPPDGAMSLNPGSRGVTGRVVVVCGAITGGAGVLILVGWAIGSDALTAMGTGYIPMAPNTALLFVLLGSAVLVREVWSASRGIHRAAAAAAVFSAVVAGVTLIGFAIGLNIEDWLFRTTRMLGAVPIGRASPVTAFCFVLAGVSLLLLECEARTWAAILGILITLVGSVCLMGYWFGAPLLYGGTVIPVALPTSLALVALGVGLTAAAGPDTWPLNALIGSSTRARLLRAVLPTVVLLALINSWITSILHEHSDPGIVHAAAITAISFLLVVSYAVTRVSRTIGDAIDRTQAEHKRAQETQAWLAAIVENSNDAIIGRLIDGTITSWNAAAERLFGYSATEVIGQSVSPIVPPDLQAQAAQRRAQLKNGQASPSYETERIAKDGRRIPVSLSQSVIRDEYGVIIGVSVIFHDITERKRAEEQLAALNAGLEVKVASRTEELAIALEAATESDRLKSDFMANVTHELRTPLNSVIGFAELLKDEVPGPLNAKQAAFAADILAGGQHLLALVEGILEMSRFDVAGVALARESVNIGAAIEERVAAYRQAAEARGVTMRLDVALDAGSAELDPKALRRMLDALLDNAIKFNCAGGTVAVSARRADGALEIAVADTGIGIAQEDLTKLFKPFDQLDAGLARKHGGVGVGLALARRLAELHGGTIEVESEPGKGSTFTLRLPIQEDS